MYRSPASVEAPNEVVIVDESSLLPKVLLVSAIVSLVAGAASVVARLAFALEVGLPMAAMFLVIAGVLGVLRAGAWKRLVVSHVAEERAFVVVVTARETTRERYVFTARPEVDLKYVQTSSPADGPEPPPSYKVVVRGKPKQLLIEQVFVKPIADRIAAALRSAIATWPSDD